MFNFRKIREIQKILCVEDIQGLRVFGKLELGLYQTEAELIAKELKKSINSDFIKLSIEAVFRDIYEDDFIYDPEKIERAQILVTELYKKIRFVTVFKRR